MKRLLIIPALLIFLLSCEENTDETDSNKNFDEWSRYPSNPVYRDIILSINYEVASDPHVFHDSQGQLWMIYSGDHNGSSSIKLAKGSDYKNWTFHSTLLGEPGPSGLDIEKETSFYRFSDSGKHQIYYIGYSGEGYTDEHLYLAESDSLTKGYVLQSEPIVETGTIAGKNVRVITSPSVMEYKDSLYLVFLAWNDYPAPTMVWTIGATSSDDGLTWNNFRVISTPVGMEGQVTKDINGTFYAVATSDANNSEAIFLSESLHPFGPWSEPEPILYNAGPPYEKDEIIGAQLTIDPVTGEKYLFYTGADHQKGWWIMLAEQ